MEILRKRSVPFDVVPARISELNGGENPRLECSKNALMKAESVARENPGRNVLGADTILILVGRLYGIPRDGEVAFLMLKSLSGRIHSVFTAGAIARLEGGLLLSRDFSLETKVEFKKLSDEKIREYMSKVDVFDKAGAYAAQENGSMIISKVDGDFENVMGLSGELAVRELGNFFKIHGFGRG